MDANLRPFSSIYCEFLSATDDIDVAFMYIIEAFCNRNHTGHNLMTKILPSKALSDSSLCLELAVEAERLCRDGQLEKGIVFFHKALNVGTYDLNCLSAIYCQLGNAYFYRQNYPKALEYHRWDLALARRIFDLLGESQASGNLGNDLRMLNKYEEAIMCFNRQLDLARELDDKKLEASALYNLGTVYHVDGKQKARLTGQSDPGEYPICAAEAQRIAVTYYKQNLQLLRELSNRPAEGRVLGNLGNAYYLLGNFNDAITCYQQRLDIADEFGDLAAQRRTHANIGNAYVFLADFKAATEHYRKALQIAIRLNDVALQAQACYSLGNTYTLLREPATAVVYHLRHLVIARRLQDRVGEGRAHWSLANAYCALQKYDRALRCSKRHRKIAHELSDNTGYLTAHLMIQEILNNTARTAVTQTPAVDQTDLFDYERSNSARRTHHSTHHQQQRECPPQSTSSTPLLLSSLHLQPPTTCLNVANSHTFLSTKQKRQHLLSSSLTDINGNEIINATTNDNNIITDKNNITQTNIDINHHHHNDILINSINDSEDPDLDHELEQELLANYSGILDTVELVTLTETGQIVVSRMGCLDVPNLAKSETDKQNMVEFYMNMPTFRLNSTRLPINCLNNWCEDLSTAPVLTASGVEENLETIEPIPQSTRYTVTNSQQHSPTDRLLSGSGLIGQTSSTIAINNNTVAQEGELLSQQEEFFFSLLLKSQSRRMDEQRCCLRTDIISSDCVSTHCTTMPNNNNNVNSSSTATMLNPIGQSGDLMQREAFFDLIEGVQGDRMNDQRAALPVVFPGLRSGLGLQILDDSQIGNSLGSCGHSDGLPEPHFYRTTRFPFTFTRHRSASTNSGRHRQQHQESQVETSAACGLDDEFLEMIFRLQAGTRINDQRSNLPDPMNEPNSLLNTDRADCVSACSLLLSTSAPVVVPLAQHSRLTSAPTVPDEDFFALIQRVQSTRLDEQRCNPPRLPPQPPLTRISADTTFDIAVEDGVDEQTSVAH